MPVTVNDNWHIVSSVKVMTSTVIARLAGKGTQRWDSTLPSVFENMDLGLANGALQQLLTRTAGLIRSADETCMQFPE